MTSVPARAVAVWMGCAAAACGGALGEAAGGGEDVSSPVQAGHSLVGNPAPKVEVDSANGKGKVWVGRLNGKVAIVDFWATWCEPCKKSFPKLQGLSAKYKAQGLQIIGISEDDEITGIPAFGKAFAVDFPLVWDGDKAIAGRWKPESMPTTFIVDRMGIVRFVHRGYHDGEETDIEAELRSLL